MHIFDICQSNFIMFNLKTHPNEPQLRMVFFSEKFYSKKKKKVNVLICQLKMKL